MVRPNVLALAETCADKWRKAQDICAPLDKNESPFNAPMNRYPSQTQQEVKRKIAKVKAVREENIFLGNGCSEIIDLIYRVFCHPGRDNVVAISPTYSEYERAAKINAVEYRKAALDEHFDIDLPTLSQQIDGQTKVIFICHPNNPTGNLLTTSKIIQLLNEFEGIVVVDETYLDFSSAPSFRQVLDRFPNLILLDSFSQYWAAAGIRLGMAFLQEPLRKCFDAIRPAFNVSALTQSAALELLDKRYDIDSWKNAVIREKEKVRASLLQLPFCKKVFPSETNFLLVQVTDAKRLEQYLSSNGIRVLLLKNLFPASQCLRISVGSPQENTALLSALRQYTE